MANQVTAIVRRPITFTKIQPVKNVGMIQPAGGLQQYAREKLAGTPRATLSQQEVAEAYGYKSPEELQAARQEAARAAQENLAKQRALQEQVEAQQKLQAQTRASFISAPQKEKVAPPGYIATSIESGFREKFPNAPGGYLVDYEKTQRLEPVLSVDYAQERKTPSGMISENVPPKILYGQAALDEIERVRRLKEQPPEPLPIDQPRGGGGDGGGFTQPTPENPLGLPQPTPPAIPLPQQPIVPTSPSGIANLTPQQLMTIISEEKKRLPIGFIPIRKETQVTPPPTFQFEGNVVIPYREFTFRERFFQGLQSFEEDIINPLSEGTGNIISLGGILERDIIKEVEPTVSTAPTETGGKGTAIFVKPTFEQQTPEQRVTSQVMQIQTETGFKEYVIEKEIIEKYTEQVKQGKITPNEATIKANEEYLARLVSINDENQKKYDAISDRYIGDVLIAESALAFGKGFVIAGITSIAPPIGLTIGGIELAKTLSNTEELITTASTAPIPFAINIGAGIAGGIAGGIIVPKVGSTIVQTARIFNKEYIAPEKIIEKAILEERQRFPESRQFDPVKRANEFIERTVKLPESDESLGGFHATPEVFPKQTTAQAGSSEYAGLYIAPTLSSYFLKLSQAYKLFGLNLKSLIKTPTAIKVYLKDILPLISKASMKEGYGYVTSIKPELEAVVPMGTRLSRIRSRFYTRLEKGGAFPIQEYQALTKEEATSIPKELLLDIRNILKYETPERVSIVQPSYFQSFSRLTSTSRFSLTSPSSRTYFSRTSNISRNLPSYTSKIDNYISRISDIPSTIISPTSGRSIFGISKISTPLTYPPYSPPSIPRIPYLRIPRIPIKKEKERKKSTRGIAYSVFLKRRGRFERIATGLPRGRALKFGSEATIKELSRRFRIKEAGITEEPDISFKPREDIFRQYKERRGRRLDLGAEDFIQRTMANLQSPEEKRLIKQSRRARRNAYGI